MSRGESWTRTQSARWGAVALVLGLTVFTAGAGTAWAEPDDAGSPGTSVSHSATGEHKDAPASASSTSTAKDDASDKDSPSQPKHPKPGTKRDKSDTTSSSTGKDKDGDDSSAPTTGAPTSDATQSSEEPASTTTPVTTEPKPESSEPKSTKSDPESTTDPTDAPVVSSAPGKESKKSAATATPDADPVSTPKAAAPSHTTKVEDEADTRTAPATTRVSTLKAEPAAAVATLNAAAVETTTPTPGPVSPIAQIAALPGRIVNAFLQLVGITTSAGTGQSPISPAPIADLFFAVFRRLEEVVGLHAPVALPTPPTLVYDGPLDTPTPTVKQFLDASSAEYVLGGTPAGMVPFTVNGWPLTSTHLDTGSDASVWVTPQNQIIIAYSGTTGGTNLLFNPLIAVTQIITDLQAGLGTSTPPAFDQAVDFAQAVKAEAAKQGYADSDIFVTGHSLGAWQAQYVAQQIGLNGIGFEGPGLNTTVPGNGKNALFINTATYGDIAGYLASDLPGLNPFAPPYVPGGGAKPHYGPIVLLGDPSSNIPMANAAALWGQGPIASLISIVDLFGNFFASHLPGVQAYNLDVDQDPGVVPWLGIKGGTVHTGFGDMTLPEFLKAASDAGILVTP